ncbi:cysteine desulfurase [Candidatus Azambacteria bacterium]|nr:cysteine desulfurase [Candidatus Azambacteria bacterium]MBI3685538.1 cysteine desulfurase [Candidatus Azambacteria bacterium]
MKRIYLDYAASTPVDEEVLKAMLPYFSETYGNPSSVHAFGQDAQSAVDTARAKTAAALGCLSQEIIFTGSATEANNLALIGVAEEALKKRKNIHIISSRVEHESVLEPLSYLEKERGASVTYLPVTSGGFVRPEDVQNALREDTALVSIMYANNEVGTIQPIAEIANVIRAHNKKFRVFFHTDAAQAASYLPLAVAQLGVDLMTLSGHKMYGPKGVGALYIKKGTPVAPLVHGGGQEYGKRSGTENVPAVVGFAAALERAVAHREEAAGQAEALRNYFIAQITARIPDTRLNGSRENRLPNNANILFPGANAAELIVALDMEGIAVSAGSACQSKALAESHVLSAIGLSKKDAKSSLRFSFGNYTTKEDLDAVLDILVKLEKKFRVK